MQQINGGVTMLNKYKILVVEDEEDIRNLLKIYLNGYGYEVVEAKTGEEAISIIKTNRFDLILLDWMLPGISGVEIAKVIKHFDNSKDTGIIMLTAKSEPNDIIQGLEAGADDYLTKPFDEKVLAARVKALIRRVTAHRGKIKSEEITFGPLQISLRTYEAVLDGVALVLTPSEFKLLATMVFNRGRVMTRDRLIEEVQGEGVSVIGRTVDTHVFGLRKKLGKYGDMIETIRGVGYRISEEL